MIDDGVDVGIDSNVHILVSSFVEKNPLVGVGPPLCSSHVIRGERSSSISLLCPISDVNYSWRDCEKEFVATKPMTCKALEPLHAKLTQSSDVCQSLGAECAISGVEEYQPLPTCVNGIDNVEVDLDLTGEGVESVDGRTTECHDSQDSDDCGRQMKPEDMFMDVLRVMSDTVKRASLAVDGTVSSTTKKTLDDWFNPLASFLCDGNFTEANELVMEHFGIDPVSYFNYICLLFFNPPTCVWVVSILFLIILFGFPILFLFLVQLF